MKTRQKIARQISTPLLAVFVLMLFAAAFFSLSAPQATDPDGDIVLDPGPIPLAPAPGQDNILAAGFCLLIVLCVVLLLAFVFPAFITPRFKNNLPVLWRVQKKCRPSRHFFCCP